jgi:hypothetical protein
VPVTKAIPRTISRILTVRFGPAVEKAPETIITPFNSSIMENNPGRSQRRSRVTNDLLVRRCWQLAASSGIPDLNGASVVTVMFQVYVSCVSAAASVSSTTRGRKQSGASRRLGNATINFPIYAFDIKHSICAWEGAGFHIPITFLQISIKIVAAIGARPAQIERERFQRTA